MSNNAEKIENEKQTLSKKITNYWKSYDYFTEQASKIGRQLAFSEGAVFWLMYLNMSSNPPKLILSIFYSLLILYFVSDLLQYLYGAFKFKELAVTLRNVKNQNDSDQPDYSYPDDFVKPLNTFYVIKFLILTFSTILLIIMFSLFVNSSSYKNSCVTAIHVQ